MEEQKIQLNELRNLVNKVVNEAAAAAPAPSAAPAPASASPSGTETNVGSRAPQTAPPDTAAKPKASAEEMKAKINAIIDSMDWGTEPAAKPVEPAAAQPTA